SKSVAFWAFAVPATTKTTSQAIDCTGRIRRPPAAARISVRRGIPGGIACVKREASFVLRLADELEKQLLDVFLAVPVAQLIGSAAIEHPAAGHHRDAIAKFLDLGHDVRRKQDALARGP